MKHILVCGGRDYGRLYPHRIAEHSARLLERNTLATAMNELVKQFGPFLLIHGAARGADALAAGWVLDQKDFPAPLAFPAAWDDVARPGALVKQQRKTGKPYDVLAGHYRNQRMINEGKPDLVIAFPGGSGTADMIERARKAGIEVREIA